MLLIARRRHRLLLEPRQLLVLLFDPTEQFFILLDEIKFNLILLLEPTLYLIGVDVHRHRRYEFKIMFINYNGVNVDVKDFL